MSSWIALAGGTGPVSLVVLVVVLLTGWALADLYRRHLDDETQMIWILAILFFPIVGAAVSLLINSVAGRRRAL